MTRFLLAVQFLTIIPVKTRKIVKNKDLSQSAIYFPLVGLLLGLFLSGFDRFLMGCGVAPFLSNALLVIALIILTGGLHLDGLADTCDALFSWRDRSEMLRIMRDSHIGVMGTLSLMSIILLKCAALCAINPSLKSSALITMCILSRYSFVFLMAAFGAARQEGKAKSFMKSMTPQISLRAGMLSVLCVGLITGIKGIGLFVFILLFIFLTGKWLSQKLDGITGDILGAVSELVEGMVLLSFVF